MLTMIVAVKPHAGGADEARLGAEDRRDEAHFLIRHEATHGANGVQDRVPKQVAAAH